MSVERERDGSITIRTKNSVTAIGRIKGSSDHQREIAFQRWVDECAKLIKPGTHTIQETEQYFLAQCDAVPLRLDDRRMINFKSNVIINFFKEKLEHQPPDLDFDMTDHEIEKWQQQNDAMREEAINAPIERFGLRMRGYSLPRNERNRLFYNEVEAERKKYLKKHSIEDRSIQQQDICFFFEETTGYMYSSGGGRILIHQMIVYSGVSQEDIIERSPRFLAYITALRDLGKLPDFS